MARSLCLHRRLPLLLRMAGELTAPELSYTDWWPRWSPHCRLWLLLVEERLSPVLYRLVGPGVRAAAVCSCG